MVFNDYSIDQEKCDLPFNIDCSKRSKLREYLFTLFFSFITQMPRSVIYFEKQMEIISDERQSKHSFNPILCYIKTNMCPHHYDDFLSVDFCINADGCIITSERAVLHLIPLIQNVLCFYLLNRTFIYSFRRFFSFGKLNIFR